MSNNPTAPGPENLPKEVEEQLPAHNPAQSPGPNHPGKEKVPPDTTGLPVEESDDEDDNNN